MSSFTRRDRSHVGLIMFHPRKLLHQVGMLLKGFLRAQNKLMAQLATVVHNKVNGFTLAN